MKSHTMKLGSVVSMKCNWNGELGPTLNYHEYWSVSSVPAEAFIRNIKFRIRQQRFAEMCKSAPAVDCLSFLQTSVSEMVNHDDAKESTTFRSLVEHIRRQLVSGTSQDSREESSPSLESRSRKERMALFESLMEMFPADARAPHNDLMDLAQLTLAQTS